MSLTIVKENINFYEYGKYTIMICSIKQKFKKVPIFLFRIFQDSVYLWEIPIVARDLGEAKSKFHKIMNKPFTRNSSII